MNADTLNFLIQLKKYFLQFYGSDFFFGIKVFLAIYVTVLIADIILIIIASGPGMYLRMVRMGADVPTVRKNKMQRRWEKIQSRLRSAKESQYKLAILEADQLADEILSKVGYAGSNMGERLSVISVDQLEMIEELKAAHEVRNEIVHRADFRVDEAKTREVLEVYQKTLETLEFI